MNIGKFIAFGIIVPASFLTSSIALADNFTLGMSSGWNASPYKGYSGKYLIAPYASYDNDYFYIKGLSAGAYLYNEDIQAVSVGLSYLPLEFKPGKSDDSQIKQLDKRKSTLLAYVDYYLYTQFGNFSASIGADILNNSKSIIVSTDYSYPVRVNSQFSITSKAGIDWVNSKHNDYYYGVSRKEAERSGLSYYSAGSSFVPHLELVANYAITKQFNAFAGSRVNFLTGDAKSSPIVSKSYRPYAFVGLGYTF